MTTRMDTSSLRPFQDAGIVSSRLFASNFAIAVIPFTVHGTDPDVEAELFAEGLAVDRITCPALEYCRASSRLDPQYALSGMFQCR